MESAPEVEKVGLGVPSGDAGAVPELVARALAGSSEAFQELYTKFAPSVHAIALSRFSSHDADEVVQEVFVHAHARLSQLREPAAIGPWLHAMARNASHDRHRARARRPRSEPLHEGSAAAKTNGTGEGELRERVLHHIRSLPETYRETLLLRLVEGLSGPEIAEITGLTAASVRVNLHRGMELLRPLLSKEGWP
ncbi:RNA polymerase sigma factor [bacterium]|nr:RNA polymerase sigma factor [bacterium]